MLLVTLNMKLVFKNVIFFNSELVENWLKIVHHYVGRGMIDHSRLLIRLRLEMSKEIYKKNTTIIYKMGNKLKSVANNKAHFYYLSQY